MVYTRLPFCSLGHLILHNNVPPALGEDVHTHSVPIGQKSLRAVQMVSPSFFPLQAFDLHSAGLRCPQSIRPSLSLSPWHCPSVASSPMLLPPLWLLFLSLCPYHPPAQIHRHTETHTHECAVIYWPFKFLLICHSFYLESTGQPFHVINIYIKVNLLLIDWSFLARINIYFHIHNNLVGCLLVTVPLPHYSVYQPKCINRYKRHMCVCLSVEWRNDWIDDIWGNSDT